MEADANFHPAWCVFEGMRQICMGLTLVSCLAMAGCVEWDFGSSSDRYQSDFHYSYPLTPGGRLEVDNFNGSLEITGWDQPTCEISGVKYASTEEMRDRIKIDVRHDANLIEIRSVRPAEEFHGNLGVRYVIHVPHKVELSRIVSTNGSVHVDGAEGRAEIKTSNGAVRVESLAGMLTVHTSNGAVTADEISGVMSLHTSNGSIRAEHVMAGVEATTSNGPITVNFDEKAPVSTTPLKFETNNGRIDISLPTAPKSEIRAHTSNSSITLRLPASASARVRAETTHGQVRSDFGASDVESDKHRKRQELDETIGGGGPLIDLHTTNGSIRLLKM
jgi:DUF4097 and DUF4098 domain-containing protein YvlB